jgi:hypothetical protein
MAQLGRRTDDRSRDINESVRERLGQRLREIEGAERTARMVTEVVELETREAYIAMGEALPVGLRLVSDAERVAADHDA